MQNNALSFTSIEHYLAPPDLHEKERVESFGLLAFIISIVTLFIEAWIVYAAVQEQIGVAFAILVHLVVSGALILGFVLFTPLASNRLFMALLAITTIAAGPFGAAGTAVSMLLWLWFSLFSTAFSEWFKTIFPSPVISLPESVDEDLRTGRDEAAKHYDVEPFMDVLRFGTDDQKRRALGKITSFFSPGFAPALQMALRDNSNMIRVQAATAISIIENRFQEKLIKLTRVYRNHKDDPAVVLALANFHDDYSFTGILDDQREHANRKEAKMLYEEYLASVPNDGIIRTRYGRLLLRMGEVQSAINHFEQAAEERFTPTRAAWLAEAYFRIGDYVKLRYLARDLMQNHPDMLQNMEASVQHSLRSWASKMNHEETA